MERAAVAMRGDTQLRIVLKGAERGPFSRLGSEKLLAESLERELQRWPGDCAISRDHDASGLQPRFALAVRPRAALRCLHVDGPVHSVEFSQVRQAPLRKLHRGDWADRRDEFALRDLSRASFQRGDRVRNCEDVLERSVPSGPVADENDVVMGIDDSRDNRLPHQVHGSDIASPGGDVVADCSEAAVADQRLRDDAVVRVHCVDPAVDESQVPAISGCLPLLRRQRAQPAAETQRGTADEELPARETRTRVSTFDSHWLQSFYETVEGWILPPPRTFRSG